VTVAAPRTVPLADLAGETSDEALPAHTLDSSNPFLARASSISPAWSSSLPATTMPAHVASTVRPAAVAVSVVPSGDTS